MDDARQDMLLAMMAQVIIENSNNARDIALRERQNDKSPNQKGPLPWIATHIRLRVAAEEARLALVYAEEGKTREYALTAFEMVDKTLNDVVFPSLTEVISSVRNQLRPAG